MLRYRVLIFLMGLILVVVAGAFFLSRLTFVAQLDALEHGYARRSVESIEKAVEMQLESLSRLTGDWAMWDDTYRFIVDLNSDYVESNLNPQTMATTRLMAILYFDRDGSLRYYYAGDPDRAIRIMLSHAFLERVQSHGELIHHESTTSDVRGLLAFQGKAYLVCARPILNSEEKGPIRGSLVVIRPLDDHLLERLREIAGQHVRLSVLPSSPEAASKASFAETSLSFDDSHYTGRVVLSDLSGRPACVLSARFPRLIHQRAIKALSVYTVCLAGGVIAVCLLFWFVLDRRLFKRLSAAVEKTRRFRSLHAGPGKTPSADEIDTLSNSLNDLIETLERALEERDASQAELQDILEGYPGAMFLIDREARTVTWANSKAQELTGRSLQDLQGTDCKKTVCPSPDPKCPVLDRGRRVREEECSIPTASGQRVPVLRSVVEVTFLGRPHLLETASDLSELKKVQAELERARKMETVGLLAGGVAHDLNNLLTPLVGYPDFLLHGLDPQHPFHAPLQKIRDSAQKAAALVQDLLTLARRGVKTEETIGLNSFIESYLTSPEFEALRSTHPQVRFQRKMGSSEIHVRGSAAHLHKALSNLVRNAAEAVTDTGLVTIHGGSVRLNEPLSAYETVPPGHYAILSVSDTGLGIDPKDLERIFEPFYTKKKMGRSGSGLGMTILWHTVKDMGGFVDIRSELGKGTTVTLYLPVADPPEALEQEAAGSSALVRGQGQTILLVEDQEEQRLLVETGLSDLGYRVISAPDGPAAIQLAREESPDLILLDMVLDEDMDGADVYREVLSFRPHQKAVVVSGYTDNNRLKEVLRLGAWGFLAKPYTMDQLARTVHQALNDDGGNACRKGNA
ncbi:PAS domain S-box-containing protein [Desulfacinum hydrothermale DSM 13146]|uniref:histidine kinase n=1 Tax=Desulfacinum hydrothermale DSM 13146 TaxID=1121390 RepID=A0A1W1XDF3_9BACT|nr:CHASE4 domain-containing protein [Desulfacinum hydrothermale]SMC21913.1 PAS domain S-box-containing protein [Desulfacinum hydrothermale DSM 13146]